MSSKNKIFRLSEQRPGLFIISLWALLFLAFTGMCHGQETDASQKQLLAGNDGDEEIIIDDIHYPIPAPWKGNKVSAPKLSYEDFKQIPLKFCKDEGKVYIVIEAQKQLVIMLDQAEKEGLLIQVESGYRSASYQKKIFRRMLSQGREFDDIIRYVAPPGYSNHMLGTAVDFSPSNWRFADTEQYIWLQKNGRQFGFAETYSRTNDMKMPWEAWHWQYMGLPETKDTGFGK